MVQYDKVATAFGRYFNADHLHNILESKAELSQVEAFLDSKASRSELSYCIGVIENLTQKIRQLS